MQSLEDEEREAAGSPNGSSENDADEDMEDVGEGDADADADADADPDADAEGDNDEDNEDNEEEEEDQDDNQADTTPQLGQSSSQPNPTVFLTSPSPRPASTQIATALPWRPGVRPEALTAPVYDIVPTIAAPHSTSINAVTATPDMRWVFSGGADGYVRKFNWVDTVNSKVMLTVAQRHPFVDSVTKAGVLTSYWENEEPQIKLPGDDTLALSPVYSLAVHHRALWLLSGLESGCINLQSVRHDEGKRITSLRKHTSAVSVLTLAHDEKSVLSGSWDKNIHDWDLNTGQVKRSFEGSGGQISAVEIRPLSSLPVPEESGDVSTTNGTYSSNNTAKPLTNGLSNGIDVDYKRGNEGDKDAPGSPADSLFSDHGGGDSLFGDNDDGRPSGPSGGNFDDEDDEFSRAIASGIQQQEDEDAEGDIDMANAGGPVQPYQQPEHAPQGIGREQPPGENAPESAATELRQPPMMNGLPHSDEGKGTAPNENKDQSSVFSEPASSDSTFLAASIDGTIRIWDRRARNPVALVVPRNSPPWCMNACWSPDGNYIYAGRRNGTVEEYSLHKGLRAPERTFKFPQGSGPVSAVRAMPNGRHLICASYDILRLYDLKEQQVFKHSAVPFLIVPGHRTGVVSQLYIDPACKYMISTAGNRGWEGNSTEVLLGYEIGIGQ
ncbi:WD40 repeat-like protein [Xylona heveae TC161]|uniref:Mitochondrial division protein 1 n=1 Tax=Xylona heveae (strain CBS 132557 / TC161) TaxID=1328760 RepID=A0A165H714_XYLHT|nr:WD40 repeat-like protein [Xylona heveae TC161]KZF23073.1 WD40 repeat-like protein [Xylona heveae TC161]